MMNVYRLRELRASFQRKAREHLGSGDPFGLIYMRAARHATKLISHSAAPTAAHILQEQEQDPFEAVLQTRMGGRKTALSLV